MADFELPLAAPNIPPVSTGDGQPPNVLELPSITPLSTPRAMALAQAFRQGAQPSRRLTPPGPQGEPPTMFTTPGAQRGLLPRLQDIVAHQESRGARDPYDITGKKGEIGKYQIMPATAAQYGFSPESLRASPQLQDQAFNVIMGDLLRKTGGDPSKALAAWNAGLGAVQRGTIPSSTRQYVSKAMSLLGPSSAYAEEPPAAPGSAALGYNPFGGGAPPGAPTGRQQQPSGQPTGPDMRPVDINRLRSVISHLPQDRQQRILAGAERENQRISLSKLPVQEREDAITDIRHPYYKYFRRPATAAAEKVLNWAGTQGPGAVGAWSPQATKNWARILVPQTPTMAAIQGASLGLPLGEMAPELEEGATAGLSTMEQLGQGLKPFASSLPRRVATMAGIGGTTSALTGDSFQEGAETGAAAQGLSEIIGGLLGIGTRAVGKGSLLKDMENQVSGEVGQHLPPTPGAQPRPFNMQDFRTPDKVVQDVYEATAPERQSIYQQTRNAKFSMPKVKGSNPDKWEWDRMGLKEAEEQLTRMGDLSYTTSSELKSIARARDIRELANSLRGDIARGLNPSVRARWLGVRRQLSAAQALNRLFMDYNIIDPKSGAIDQPQLVKGLKERAPDLRRVLGRDGWQRLQNIATRAIPRWYTRPSPHKGVEDQPSAAIVGGHIRSGGPTDLGAPHISFGIPRTYRPIGNVPIWLYPPKSGLTYFTAPLATPPTNLPTAVNPTPGLP